MTRALLVMALCSLFVMTASDARTTDLGDGNADVAQMFEKYKKGGPRTKKSDAKRKVMITGFGLFSGVDYNISGVVVESMASKDFWPAEILPTASYAPPQQKHVGKGTLTKKDGGVKVWQRTLKFNGREYEVAFILLDVLWDLGPAITLFEAQNFQPHLIIMTGRGGARAVFEGGAVNNAAKHPGFRFDGKADEKNRPTQSYVLDPKLGGIEAAIPTRWNNKELADATRDLIRAINPNFEVSAPANARPANNYICNNITVHNLEPLSTFLGKVGDPDRGGLGVEEFKRRQRLHLEAEIDAMRDVAEFIHKARDIYGYEHFINDAGGSVCELPPGEALDVLVEHTLILYIRADEAMERELMRRAVSNPKPMYYAEAFFDRELAAYLTEQHLSSSDQIDPDHFVQWIFPRLLEHRRPLYQGLADRHGYTVDAQEVETVRDEADFLELVASAIDRSEAPCVHQANA